MKKKIAQTGHASLSGDDRPTGEGQPTRRTVVKGVAWSLPIISAAVTAPLATASGPCSSRSYRLNWTSGAWSGGGTSGSGEAVASDGSTITVSAVAVPVGTAAIDPNNLSPFYPQLNMLASYNSGMDVTFTFSQPITGLQFTLGDFDGNTSAVNYWDAVQVSGAAYSFTYTASQPFGMQGDGTSSAPFRSQSPGTVAGPNIATQGVTFTFGGPLTSFTIHYRNAYPRPTLGSVTQQLFFSDMTFSNVC
ncbi:hypothetical protein AB0N59_03210 [Microbacterium sp. NPDC089321]|uniref:hypothetical protein n=1 Tax=Microbacterium sp. NPDC089321 TaxID=3155183 RepID=UPI003414AFF2